MSIRLDVSIGEFVDKLTILQIKADRISAPDKLRNVRRELEGMLEAWRATPFAHEDIAAELEALRGVNETLWDLEDAIRAKEARAQFDREFIELARAIYRTNDARADMKRRLNERLGSELIEEKSYCDAGRGA